MALKAIWSDKVWIIEPLRFWMLMFWWSVQFYNNCKNTLRTTFSVSFGSYFVVILGNPATLGLYWRGFSLCDVNSLKMRKLSSNYIFLVLFSPPPQMLFPSSLVSSAEVDLRNTTSSFPSMVSASLQQRMWAHPSKRTAVYVWWFDVATRMSSSLSFPWRSTLELVLISPTNELTGCVLCPAPARDVCPCSWNDGQGESSAWDFRLYRAHWCRLTFINVFILIIMNDLGCYYCLLFDKPLDRIRFSRIHIFSSITQQFSAQQLKEFFFYLFVIFVI